jgi:hypothetical protein
MRPSISPTATPPQRRQSPWKREVTQWSMYRHRRLLYLERYLERSYVPRFLSTFRARRYNEGYEFAKDQYVTFSPEELKELEEKGTGTVEMMQKRSKAHARGQAQAVPARRTGGAGTLCGCVTECMAGIFSVRTERPHETIPRRLEPACTNFAAGLAVIPRR